MKKIALLVLLLTAQVAYTQTSDKVTFTNVAGDYTPNYFSGCQTDIVVWINGKKPSGKINLSVPYNQAIITKEGDIFHVVPAQVREMHVTVLSDEVAVAEIVIVVRPVPTPVSKIVVDGKLREGNSKISRNAKLIELLPDKSMAEDFAKSCPRDTTYSVVSMVATIDGKPLQCKSVLDLSKAYGIKGGEIIMLSNVLVHRTTWDGKTVEVIGSKMSCTIPVE